MICLPDSQGKAAFDRSASVSFCSTSRERGPASTSTPQCVVTGWKLHAAVRRQELPQHVVVVALQRAGRDEVEARRRASRRR